MYGPNAEVKFTVAGHNYLFECDWEHGRYCVFKQSECHRIEGSPILAQVGEPLDYGLIEHDALTDKDMITNLAPQLWGLNTDVCYEMQLMQNYKDPRKGKSCIVGKRGSEASASALNDQY